MCVCVREREREREIDRQTDGSDVTLVALKLAKSFALYLAKNLHLSFSPPNGAEFTLPLPKVALFETVHILRKIRTLRFAIRLSNRVTGDRSIETNNRISGCTVLLLIAEKMNQINTKNH